jgi:Type IV Pilus-assembly protein W/Prokaryotic N-terminal methylation motif
MKQLLIPQVHDAESKGLSNAASGFTIVEIMVSMVIGLLLMFAVAKVFDQTRWIGRSIESTQTIQDGSRFALDRIAYTLRMSKNAGCIKAGYGAIGLKAKSQSPTDVVNLIAGTGTPPSNLLNDNPFNTAAIGEKLLKDSAFIRGYASGNGFTLSNGTSMTLATAIDKTNGLNAVPDAITIIGTDTDFQHLFEPMVNKDDNVSTVNKLTWGQTGGVRLMMISNCAQGEIFYGGPGSGHSGKDISHDAISNNSAEFRKSYKSQSYVSFVDIKNYFVAKNADFARDGYILYEQSMMRNTTANPAYWVMGIPQPILNHITRFNIEYGLDTTGDGVVDVYKAADNVTDWSQVLMVRVILGVETAEKGTAATKAGAEYGDQVQQVFTTQVEIRN